MPQLDTLSFFSQYIWTTFVFFGFFLLLTKYFLPTMGRALLFQETFYSTAPSIEKNIFIHSLDLNTPTSTIREGWVSLFEGSVFSALLDESKSFDFHFFSIENPLFPFREVLQKKKNELSLKDTEKSFNFLKLSGSEEKKYFWNRLLLKGNDRNV